MKLTIDGIELSARDGSSVLDVALQNDIDIPHLCSHPDLSPYGGCRLCLVEVEGMRGYPPSCTTQAREGMVVRTQTDALLNMRREMLQLILSEHPSSCLICTESQECITYQGTIRKVGVTTGCRFCPKDGVCELQAVTKSLGVTELTLPNIYRDQPVENGEEFYDRDYNLCIYCARCVRVCQEQRQAAVLSLRQRGPLTTIGPAFEMSHYDAGCEFCGACVSVCPTGALSEKGRKWAGAGERLAPSVCTLCSQQCDIQAVVVKDRVVGTVPPDDPRVAGGELCVKGRFCLADLANRPGRLRVPTLQTAEGSEEVNWEEATAAVAEKLREIQGERIAIYVSPDLLLEDLATLRRLADEVLHTENVTTTAVAPGSGELLRRSFASPDFDELSSSDCIVSLFFNGNYGYAPTTLGIKRAANKGTRYYQIGWLSDPTSRFASQRVTPKPGQEAALMRNLVKIVSGQASDDAELTDLAEAMRSAGRTTFVLGMGVANLSEAAELLAAIDKMVEQKRATVVTPHPHGNLLGLLAALKLKSREDVEQLVRDGKIDALWIIGESPFQKRPPVNVVIYQNTFPPPEELGADIVLPAASWCEVSGSLVAADGQSPLKAVQAAVRPPGQALQDGEIFTEVAKVMGAQNLDAPSAEELSTLAKDARKAATAFLEGDQAHEQAPPAGEAARNVLVREVNPHRFRGLSLADSIEGMARLAPEETLFVNPLDAAEWDVRDGDALTISTDGQSRSYPVRLDRKVTPSLLYMFSSSGGDIVSSVRVEARSVKELGLPLCESQPHSGGGAPGFKIVKHQRMVPNIYLMEVEAPEVAEQVQPGQFVIVRSTESGERIPLSVADWDRKAGTVTVVFMEVGASTGRLARLKAGDSIPTLAGPLGKPTEITGEGQVLCVAGCYGIASMMPIVRALHEAGAEVTVVLEARARFLLYWEDRMRALAKHVFTVTRDGSSGERGHVTSLPEMLRQAGVTPSRVMVNGCTFLMSQASKTLGGLGVPVTVSLNPIMIDGTGMCGVCRTSVGGQRKFACVDGPDFDGREVDWKELLSRRKQYMSEEAYLCHRASCSRGV